MESEALLDTTRWIRFPGYGLVRPWLESITGIRRVNRIYQNARLSTGSLAEFCDAVLDELGIRLEIAEPPGLPQHGPLMVLGNHPTGMIEAVAMMRLLEQARPGGWKFLGNRVVADAGVFRDHAIAVVPSWMGARHPGNGAAMARALRFLREGGCLGAFPAGRVAPGGGPDGWPMDAPWSPHFTRLARLAGARVFLLWFPLRSGRLLRCLPFSMPRLRGMFLAREALRPAHRGRGKVRCVEYNLNQQLSRPTGADARQFCHELSL